VLKEIHAVLATTGERWQRLVETVPEGLLERAPAPGEWSAADCLRHVLAGERNMLDVRLAQFLEGATEWVPSRPAQPDPSQPIAEVVAEFVRLRGEHVARIAGLTPADLDRTMRHPEHGDVTLGQLLSGWSGHDLQHMAQAEVAMLQIFLPGSGIWRRMFAHLEAEAAGPS
jgi:hypothetical protein